ncbi:UbiA prenyltransferase family protein [Candidatus Woesearchaeota archaeon]|nr:UbiA prenyltransferase family protein [Candidatus Woesearchaeota archaeon]
MVIKIFADLIRVKQWYKNLVVFLPLIFSLLLFNKPLLLNTILAFISLCFISSANYIINDLLDIKNDRIHPEKRLRSIASGRISALSAVFFSLVFFMLAILIAYILSINFLLIVLILFLINSLYSIFLKKEPFVDILVVATNFVLRAISGVFVINRDISPWLILCPFFLALFLIIGKRRADLEILKEDAYKHKEVLKFYTSEITGVLLTISTTLLIISYSLYAFLSGHKLLLVTLPVSIFVIFRYLHLIYIGSEIPRSPEKMYKDKALFFGTILWIILIFLILYI